MKLTEALIRNDYVQCKFDYSMITKRKGNDIVVLLIYVDDLLITGSSSEMITELKSILNQNFKMKDSGKLEFLLGTEIARSEEGIVLNQRKYAVELIAEAGLGVSKTNVNTNGTI